jgi:hypothetical protein
VMKPVNGLAPKPPTMGFAPFKPPDGASHRRCLI